MQAGLIYHGKTTLNYATFEAARQGAVNHAQFDSIKDELTFRLAPLHGGDGTVAKAAQAIAKAKATSLLPARTNIRILNPTPEAFDDWGEMSIDAGVRAIPNSHLRHRTADRNTIGALSGLNLHDANLLKIKVTHGFEMKIPLVSTVIAKGMMLFDADNTHYYLQNQLPITSVVTVRMQNEAWEQDWEAGTTPPVPVTDTDTNEGTTTANTLVPEDEDTDAATNQTDNTEGTTTESTDNENATNTSTAETTDEIQCETTWEDERYTANTNNRWWNPYDWKDDVKAAAAIVWDFFEGALAGLGDQVKELWELLKDPTVLWDVAKAFVTDPKGTIEAIVKDLGEQVQRVLECGPKDIGKVIGQNINPAIAVKLLGKLGSLSGNAKLADYANDFSRKFKCASFPAGTEIWTPKGPVFIEDISVGTLVNSRNEIGFQSKPQSVTGLLGRVANGYQIIKTEGGMIRTTPEHPLWVQGKGWINASDVVPEDPLGTMGGDLLVLSNVYFDQATNVFNFSVANTPNYFAGPMGLWVHNAGRRTCWDQNDLDGRLNQDTFYDIDPETGREIHAIDVDGETRLVYRGFDNRYYDYDAYSPSFDGLSVERAAYWRRQINEAELNGNSGLADQARYQRYLENKVALEKEPMSRADWQVRRDRVAENQRVGALRENAARTSTSNLDGMGDLQNNNSGNFTYKDADGNPANGPATFETPNGNTTRPDSIATNSNGDIIAIHEHKNVNGQPPVVYETDQIRGQINAAEANGAKHVLTISSDAGLGTNGHPIARPSSTFNNRDSDIFYYDKNTGSNTHKWDRGENQWVEI